MIAVDLSPKDISAMTFMWIKYNLFVLYFNLTQPARVPSNCRGVAEWHKVRPQADGCVLFRLP